MPDDDVAERAGSDVTVERLDRATELGSGLRSGEKATGRGVARLARGRRGGRAVARRKRKRMRERLAALKPFRQRLCNG
jgi:hypothetical protein